MRTVKKAQMGKLVKKGVQAATKNATKNAPKVSKWDYPTQESRDFQRQLLKDYPQKIKKMPKGNNKVDKVKKDKPKYDKYGLEILKDKNGGKVTKAKSGTSVKKAMMGNTMTKPMMKKGGTMKKCKYGCK